MLFLKELHVCGVLLAVVLMGCFCFGVNGLGVYGEEKGVRFPHPSLSSSSVTERRVSYWMSTHNISGTNNAVANIGALGGRQVATSVFLYCGSSVNDTGFFFSSSGTAECQAAINGFHAFNISAEVEVHISLIGLRYLMANPDVRVATVQALKQDALKYNLQGVAWDLEPEGSDHQDCINFAQYLGEQAAALNPIGVRVTTYSNVYAPVIADVGVLATGANLVTGGETYNGNNLDQWMQNYKQLVSSVEDINLVSPGMLASSERGSWNCETGSMQERVNQFYADKLVEFSIFVLTDPQNPSSGNCVSLWFQYAREFLNTPF
eukprot:m.7600 g.7600  ORF g.7600 m.7600 type:complete len:321 (-) comp5843_c0_seq1:278-1240(-)